MFLKHLFIKGPVRLCYVSPTHRPVTERPCPLLVAVAVVSLPAMELLSLAGLVRYLATSVVTCRVRGDAVHSS